ncbi:MAG: DNA-binding response regulator [Proteobacteria bacterium]|nr:DNA-binding response regulator [Pseudomonadota bacterium]
MSGRGKSVLIVDDEAEICSSLEMALRPRGYEVRSVESGEQALDSALERPPDLVILDLSLPGMNGLEVCKRLREHSQVPIIVLSVRSAESDKITALDLGADDYVTKPFALGELLARMRTAFRHAAAVESERSVYEFDGLKVNFTLRQVTVQGRDVRLTPKEFDLLHYFIQHADSIATHANLLAAVWGDEYREDKPLLRVHIANLRQKLEPNPSRPTFIVNEPGVGYRFRTSATE